MPSPADDPQPCLTCGACCAFFRVTFYWAEADDALTGTVPVTLTERLGPHTRCMAGTGGPTPRCVALAGEIGRTVHCTIYDNRPTPCREFAVSGAVNDQCDRARAAWGLPPLRPLPADRLAQPGGDMPGPPSSI